ncbi:hypothetical protein CGLO_07427 [Colletotrichum gloeosporioides Cg-14]|uniref:DUF676 domain-containing protein n=1 Tax=Colletotrichum gloeosporioides (strain Cg-14) TaxID=1237896 RepID=T0LMH7_COLGC|nr:hypothetical protein CGLO_07427 [Colletotrichum gloeosporioides Cg-14]
MVAYSSGTRDRLGLTELYPGANDVSGDRIENDIVFVHGLRGRSHSTWTAENEARQSVMWPEQLLPDDLDCTRSRIMTYGYDANVKNPLSNASMATIRHHSDHLLHSLKTERSMCRERPLVFVAHSLGGLIVKDAVHKADNSIDYSDIGKYTKAILFFGTPHHGSSNADFGGAVVNILSAVPFIGGTNKDIVNQLQPSDISLQDLEDNFSTLATKRRIENPIHIACFYEDVAIPGLNKIVVPRRSATMEAYTKIKFDTDHFGLVKFGERDWRYKSVLGELRSVLPIAPEKVKNAIMRDNDRVLQRIIDTKCFDFNKTIVDSDTGYAICLAAHRGRVKTFRLLVNNPNVDHNIQDRRWRQTPLIRAAKGINEFTGNFEITELLLQKEDVEIDTRDKWGQTALLSCVKERVPKGVRLLLDADANRQIKDDEDRLPIYWAGENLQKAAEQEDEDQVQECLEIMKMLDPRAARRLPMNRQAMVRVT